MTHIPAMGKRGWVCKDTPPPRALGNQANKHAYTNRDRDERLLRYDKIALVPIQLLYYAALEFTRED